METKAVCKQLEALANETRLAVFAQLCKVGKNGMNVGHINNIVAIPASTLSHHLNRLVNAGLVNQVRNGRHLVCTANQDKVDELVMHLATECCGEDSSIWG